MLLLKLSSVKMPLITTCNLDTPFEICKIQNGKARIFSKSLALFIFIYVGNAVKFDDITKRYFSLNLNNFRSSIMLEI
jgi:hypothetical protein